MANFRHVGADIERCLAGKWIDARAATELQHRYTTRPRVDVRCDLDPNQNGVGTCEKRFACTITNRGGTSADRGTLIFKSDPLQRSSEVTRPCSPELTRI